LGERKKKIPEIPGSTKGRGEEKERGRNNIFTRIRRGSGGGVGKLGGGRVPKVKVKGSHKRNTET